MGRPRKTGLDYFNHDIDARRDTKIRAISGKWGAQGYAWYFQLLEIVYGEGHSFRLDSDLMLPAIAEQLTITVARGGKLKHRPMEPGELREYIGDCCDIGLFDAEYWAECGAITSNAIAAKLLKIDEERQKSRAKWDRGKEVDQ